MLTITILGIIASVIFVMTGDYLARARDTARMVDIQEIRKGLMLYGLERGVYPESTASGCVPEEEILIPEGYLKHLRISPSGTTYDE